MALAALDASVILATYNQLESTSLALRALFAQDTAHSYEVIVCDDGSDSQTTGALSELLQDSPIPVRLVWQQDKGFRAAASRNNGIRLANGRIIILLDGDMVPEQHFVQSHVQAHNEQRLVAIGQRRWRDPAPVAATIEKDGNLEALWAHLRDEESVERLTKATEAFEMLYRHILGKAAPWMACLTCNISIEKSPLVEFDESFVGWGYEDFELFYRLNIIHGFRVQPIEADAYEVRGHTEFERKWTEAVFISHLVNGFRFYEKWAHTGLTHQQAIPRYDLDPDIGIKGFSNLPVIGPGSDDFLDYVESARIWLKKNDLYPSAPGGDAVSAR